MKICRVLKRDDIDDIIWELGKVCSTSFLPIRSIVTLKTIANAIDSKLVEKYQNPNEDC